MHRLGDVDRGNDLGGDVLDAVERCGERVGLAVIELDVVAGGGVWPIPGPPGG